MKSGAGKAKGNAYERKICRNLSLWVTNNKNDEIFWRSASSGAMATQRGKNKKSSKHHGDIVSVDPIGEAFIKKYYVEIKHRKNLRPDCIVFGKRVSSESSLLNIWVDTKKKARKVKKMPLVIAKQNNQPEIICMAPASAITFFGEQLFDYVLVRRFKPDMVVFPLEAFLRHAKNP